MKPTVLAAFALGFALVASTPAQAEEAFGAVTAAPLVRGGQAVYGLMGYPSVRAGFRQGYSLFEVGAELGFDWVATDFFATATGRRTLYDRGGLNVSVDARLGGFASAGARWADTANRSGGGVRFEIGSSLAYRVSSPVSLVAFLKVPTEIPLNDGGSVRVLGLIGGGAEFALSREYFLAINAAVGPDFRSRVLQTTRLSVEAMAGFGYRVF
ncbi:MAG TPA: hypothetical protein VGK67_23170 [Myxococcales bacterium]|jgi:hypothetical protein